MPGIKTDKTKRPMLERESCKHKMQRKFFDRATQLEGAVVRDLRSTVRASQTGSLRL